MQLYVLYCFKASAYIIIVSDNIIMLSQICCYDVLNCLDSWQ
jgi:hypothetical protein